jgi:glycosyltransferase involved in cell wall biosynthesis
MSGTPRQGLRIAMVGHKGLPALHGGIERHVDEIARRLVQRGHQVDVFNRPYHPERGRDYAGIRLRRRPSLPSKHLDAATHTLLCIGECAVSRRYDLVHVHGIGPGIFTGLATAFVPTVFTFHAQDYRQRKWGRLARWSLRHGESVAVRRADAVITVSQLLQRYVRETYGREADYIPNGATPGSERGTEALGRWDLSPDRYVLFVGRLIPDRGLLTLLEAWSRLGETRTLVIAGDVQHDRDYVDTLRRHADARVRFVGFQSGTALSQLYAHASLCVHPSEVEGLPIAVLEAMGAGRAVLVSDIPENLEAIGNAGATFPVRDTAALAGALQHLLGDPAERARLGGAARTRIASVFDWDGIARATEAVYTRVVAERTGATSSLETGSKRLHPGGSN